MDLTIILDSSGSVADDWKLVVEYADKIVAGVPVGPNKSKVAIIHYNDIPYSVQHYNTHLTNAAIHSNLMDLKTARSAAQGNAAVLFALDARLS